MKCQRLLAASTTAFGYMMVYRSIILSSHLEGENKEEEVLSSFTESDLQSWTRHKLLRPDIALTFSPGSVKQFLSKQDILDLQRVIEEEGKHLPRVERDEFGRRLDFGGDKNRAAWKTTYLHSGHWAKDRIPHLLNHILRTAKEIDQSNKWHVMKNRSQLNFRTIEFHEYTEGGGLLNWRDKHFDDGSLITIDIMLTDTNEFEGGALVFPSNHEATPYEPDFEQGDAVFFLSHKFHNVTPLRKGRRQVLVCEIWDGPEKSCAHRCVSREKCANTESRYQLASVLEEFMGLM